MQTKDTWQDYTEVINKLAFSTIRKWMVGIDVEDVKQSLWAEFFRLCSEPELLQKSYIIKSLKTFASQFKREESDRKFGQRHIQNETFDIEIIGQTDLHWRKVKHLWEQYLLRLSTRDAVIMRYAAQGATNNHIARALTLEVQTVKNLRHKLIKTFREEVENNVQIDHA